MTVKTAISLPSSTYRHGEVLRRKTGQSRSELYAAALEVYFNSLQVCEMETRYAAGYRAKPEKPEELEAWSKAAAGALHVAEDW